MNRPRTTTERYHHPPIHSFPPAHECDDDDLLDIAARGASGAVWELLGSSTHVERICDLVGRLEFGWQTASEVATAESQEAARLRQIAADLAHENATLRTALIDAYARRPVEAALERIATSAGVGSLVATDVERDIDRRMHRAEFARGTNPEFDLSDTRRG